MIMNYVLSALLLVLCGVIVHRDYLSWKQVRIMDASRHAEREQWHTERQQLLDRIQAPSYDVMKHHEVKIIKAQNNEKEPPKLEVL